MLDQVRANQLLDAVHGITPLVATTAPIKIRLMSVMGSAAVNGTELASGGSYVALTGLSPLTMSAASAGSASNSAISQANMPAATTAAIEADQANATDGVAGN